MELKCPFCQAPIPANHVNISAGLATCSLCNKAFQPSLTLAKPLIESAEGIEIKRNGNELIIIRKWFSAVAFFLIFFCIAWDSFLVFWYSIAFRMPNTPWIMCVFPIGHVAVGFGLTYYTLCLFLNKTFFIVKPGQLEIWHRPLPWKGAGVIKRTDIEQIYVEQKVSSNNRSTIIRFELVAKLKNGQKKSLTKSLTDYDQARKLEQEIEKSLGITDRPVSGEFNGAV